MLRVDEVCKHSYIFSNSSIQPGHDCFATTWMVNSCYHLYILLLIFSILIEKELIYDRITVYNGGLKVPYQLLRRGRSFLALLLNLGCLGQACHRRRFYLAYSTHLIWLCKICTCKCGFSRHWYLRRISKLMNCHELSLNCVIIY